MEFNPDSFFTLIDEIREYSANNGRKVDFHYYNESWKCECNLTNKQWHFNFVDYEMLKKIIDDEFYSKSNHKVNEIISKFLYAILFKDKKPFLSYLNSKDLECFE